MATAYRTKLSATHSWPARRASGESSGPPRPSREAAGASLRESRNFEPNGWGSELARGNSTGQSLRQHGLLLFIVYPPLSVIVYPPLSVHTYDVHLLLLYYITPIPPPTLYVRSESSLGACF